MKTKLVTTILSAALMAGLAQVAVAVGPASSVEAADAERDMYRIARFE
jgi:hypothetical protein